MGAFDEVLCTGSEFVCPEGHSLSGQTFQTYDLGCTMGDWTLDASRLTGTPGNWGRRRPQMPFTGSLALFANCDPCGPIARARGIDWAHWGYEFTVELEANAVRKITRTSESIDEWIAIQNEP